MADDARSNAPGLYGAKRTVAAPIVFGSSTVVLDSLAVGDVVEKVWCDVTVAFNAASTNVITLGDGTTANKYLTSSDVTEGSLGVTPSGGKGPFTAETATGTLTATYAQTGTAASAGAGVVYAVINSLPE